MAESFLSDAEIADLARDAESGYLALEKWTVTDTITVARQGGTTVGTFAVVGIRRDNREPGLGGSGTSLVTTEQDGTLTLWAAEVTATPVRRGDRFLWNGQACVIATPPEFKRGGVAKYGFVLEARN